MCKLFLLLLVVNIVNAAASQNFEPEEIKKNKIKSITINSAIGEKQLQFDTNGQLIKELHEGSPFGERQIFYNSAQQPDSIINETGLSFLNYRQFFTYEADGSFITVTIYNDRTDTLYVGKDHKNIRLQCSDGSKIKYEYNSKHQLSKEIAIDKMGKIVTEQWIYDAQGNIIKKIFSTGPGNTVTTVFSYNARKQIIASAEKRTGTLTMPNKHSTFSYNPQGLLIKEIALSGTFNNTSTYRYEIY